MTHQDITKIAFGIASVLIAALYFGARFFINHRGSPTAKLAVKTYSYCLLLRDKIGVDSEEYMKCIKELNPLVNKLIETEEIKIYRCKRNEKDSKTVFCKVWVWWIPRELMVTNKEFVDKVNYIKSSDNYKEPIEIRFTPKDEETITSELAKNAQESSINIGNQEPEQSFQLTEDMKLSRSDGRNQKTEQSNIALPTQQNTEEVNDLSPRYHVVVQETLPLQTQTTANLDTDLSQGLEATEQKTDPILNTHDIAKTLDGTAPETQVLAKETSPSSDLLRESDSDPEKKDASHNKLDGPSTEAEDTLIADSNTRPIQENEQEVHISVPEAQVNGDAILPEPQITKEPVSPSSGILLDQPKLEPSPDEKIPSENPLASSVIEPPKPFIRRFGVIQKPFLFTPNENEHLSQKATLDAEHSKGSLSPVLLHSPSSLSTTDEYKNQFQGYMPATPVVSTDRSRFGNGLNGRQETFQELIDNFRRARPELAAQVFRNENDLRPQYTAFPRPDQNRFFDQGPRTAFQSSFQPQRPSTISSPVPSRMMVPTYRGV